jgi:hypothetical protein
MHVQRIITKPESEPYKSKSEVVHSVNGGQELTIECHICREYA